MRTFSRWMPQESSSPPWIGTLLVVLLAVAAVVFVIIYPWVLPAAAACAVPLRLLDHRRQRRLQAMALERIHESICTFVRAVPKAERDPWILRALYNDLQAYLRSGDWPIALRPSDRLAQDLGMDLEDLEDVARSIARRTGRLLEGSERNPYFGKVHTVGELAAFLRAQPQIGAV